MTKPTRLEDLKPEELYRSALEDFAIPVEEADKANKKVLLAAFLQDGVSWADYVAQHPEFAPEPEAVVVTPAVETRIVEPVREGAVTTVTEAPVEIITASLPTQQPQQKWLIKMIRDNVRFDILGHTFTQQHPYALVSPEHAEFILTHEDGFRQATPGELREFYG